MNFFSVQMNFFPVTILSYACAAKQFNSDDMKACEVAINKALKKILKYKWRKVYLRTEYCLVNHQSKKFSNLQGRNS